MMLSVSVSAQSEGQAHLGYVSYDEQMWEYDGLSLDHDSRVGAAILLTPEMLKPYAGGKIVGMRVGWDTSAETGYYNGFVRKGFHGETVSEGEATVSYDYVSYGWNDMTMQEYVIPEDVDTLVAGFYTDVRANVCCIPKIYNFSNSNSCYLWVTGDVDEDGKELWYDMSRDFGALPIMLTIQDVNGTFKNLAVVNSFYHNGIIEAGATTDALLSLRNRGSQTINSIEITSYLGDESWKQTVNLSRSILPGTVSGTFTVPVYGFRTGVDSVAITTVNNEPNGVEQKMIAPLVCVPKEVSQKYTRRPMVEYIESENEPWSPSYYENYMKVGLANYMDRVTLVCQHIDDQFMTGDNDALVMMLDYANNDSSTVAIPNMAVDRSIITGNIIYQRGRWKTPFFSVLYPDFAPMVYEEYLKIPTFASVEVSGEGSETQDAVNVKASGEIAPGILPEGEQLKLIVYLMEKDVWSDSQLYLDPDTKEKYAAEVTHVNVIRAIATESMYGESVETSADGKFTKEYTFELDETWNKDNLYLVAFLQRPETNNNLSRQIINSCEGVIGSLSGIEVISSEKEQPVRIYDLQGRRLNKLQKGINIVNGKKIVVK